MLLGRYKIKCIKAVVIFTFLGSENISMGSISTPPPPPWLPACFSVLAVFEFLINMSLCTE